MTASAVQPAENAAAAAARYRGEELRAAEEQREERQKARVAELRQRFIDGPVLVLPSTGGGSFDARGATPIPGSGMVYFSNYRVKGKWGSLAPVGSAAHRQDVDMDGQLPAELHSHNCVLQRRLPCLRRTHVGTSALTATGKFVARTRPRSWTRFGTTPAKCTKWILFLLISSETSGPPFETSLGRHQGTATGGRHGSAAHPRRRVFAAKPSPSQSLQARPNN